MYKQLLACAVALALLYSCSGAEWKVYQPLVKSDTRVLNCINATSCYAIRLVDNHYWLYTTDDAFSTFTRVPGTESMPAVLSVALTEHGAMLYGAGQRYSTDRITWQQPSVPYTVEEVYYIRGVGESFFALQGYQSSNHAQQIAYSADGGDTWKQADWSSKYGENLINCAVYPTPDVWYVVGGISGNTANCTTSNCSGLITRTLNRGRTFTTQVSTNDRYFQAVCCYDGSTCMAVAIGAGRSYVYTTSDGQTWMESPTSFAGQVRSYAPCTVSSPVDAQFILTRESDTMYAVTTSDFGASWTTTPFPAGVYDINSWWWANATFAWAVGLSNTQQLLQYS